jgi:hypothetical protein
VCPGEDVNDLAFEVTANAPVAAPPRIGAISGSSSVMSPHPAASAAASGVLASSSEPPDPPQPSKGATAPRTVTAADLRHCEANQERHMVCIMAERILPAASCRCCPMPDTERRSARSPDMSGCQPFDPSP